MLPTKIYSGDTMHQSKSMLPTLQAVQSKEAMPPWLTMVRDETVPIHSLFRNMPDKIKYVRSNVKRGIQEPSRVQSGVCVSISRQNTTCS